MGLGVVSGETKANATWVLSKIEEVLGLSRFFAHEKLYFINDRGTALKGAVQAVYGLEGENAGADIFTCYQHLLRNVTKQVGV